MSLKPALGSGNAWAEGICIAGCIELSLGKRRVFRRPGLDLATVPLSSREVSALEGDGRRIIRPATWPPQPAEVGDPMIFGGFPGAIREIESWEEGMLRAVTYAGVVTSVLDDWFSYRGDPDNIAQFDVTTRGEEAVLERLDGVSGGPVFRVVGQPVLRLDLVGVRAKGRLSSVIRPSSSLAASTSLGKMAASHELRLAVTSRSHAWAPGGRHPNLTHPKATMSRHETSTAIG